MFPKNIFQIWIQGKENITDDYFKQNIHNWEILNPDWNYICADNKMMEDACSVFSQRCLNAYKKAKAMHTKIDLGKIVLLYLYGGIAVDMDMYILRNLTSSKDVQKIISDYNKTNEHCLGLSKLNISKFESLVYSGYQRMFNNSVFVSSPKNPVLGQWIETIIYNIDRLENSKLTPTSYVSYTTGPVLFNKFIERNKENNISKIVSFESIVFEPCHIDHSCTIDKNTIAIHNFEMSWLSKNQRLLANFYYKYVKKHYFSVFLLLIIIFLIYKRKT